MIFVTVEQGKLTVADIKTMAARLLQWNAKHQQISESDLAKLHFITTPTLAADQHEEKIRKLFDELMAELVLHDDKGCELRFYPDSKTGVLYFGDADGWAEARALND